MYCFDVKTALAGCVEWTRNWFAKNGAQSPAVIGISGGKDSSVSAAICKEALGADRVFGVLMPRGSQSDIEFSYGICDFLGIKHCVVNIGDAADALEKEIGNSISVSRQAVINLPPRIRMAAVYAVSQSLGGRVINTCNMSEDWVGYSTRWGDSVGDVSVISSFTVAEVKAIGRYMGIPEKYIEKAPSDGLSGKTDEDNLGFTYAALDAYIREGKDPGEAVRKRIDSLHAANLFKLRMMDSYVYDPEGVSNVSCQNPLR